MDEPSHDTCMGYQDLIEWMLFIMHEMNFLARISCYLGKSWMTEWLLIETSRIANPQSKSLKITESLDHWRNSSPSLVFLLSGSASMKQFISIFQSIKEITSFKELMNRDYVFFPRRRFNRKFNAFRHHFTMNAKMIRI